MKNTLIIFFILFFSLTSFSVIAKEYIMTCKNITYKLVDNPSDKMIYYRNHGEWLEYCKERDMTYTHKGDAAVCTTSCLETWCFTKDVLRGEVPPPDDLIESFDFILNEIRRTYQINKKWTNNVNHKFVSFEEELCKKIY